MTGGNTDRIHVPHYMQAAAILLRIAAPLFSEGTTLQRRPDEDSKSLGVVYIARWSDIRVTTDHFFANRTTILNPEQRERLRRGLSFAHKAEHNRMGDSPEQAEICNCFTGLLLRDFALVLVEAGTPANQQEETVTA